jgi:hypothetical protein
MAGFKIGDRVSRAWAEGEFIIFWRGKCKFSGRARYGAKRVSDGDSVWGYAGDFGLIKAAPAKPGPLREMISKAAVAPKVYKMKVAPRADWKCADHKAEAYGDRYVWEAPYEGEFSEVEAKELVCGKPESSWGKLRWSGGASYAGVDPERKVVKVSEYIAMCD